MTEQPVATARRFLRRRLVANVVTLVVGGLLLAAGIGGLVYLSGQAGQLAGTGIRASANVSAVDNYHSRFQFDEHIDVDFRIAGVVVTARCWTGPGDEFTVGQPVAIVYDTNNPLHAQLARNPNPGPIVAPFLAAFVLGILLVLPGLFGLYLRRGMAAALRAPDRPMTARRGTLRRITLRDNDSELTLWAHGRVRRLPADATAVRGFGRLAPRAVMVLVEPETGAVVFTRQPKAPEDAEDSTQPRAESAP